LTTGIEIYAQPPGKKLENISLLSGGEKTMTALALLFATYQVRPSPFCLLDEIDAALDDKNVASFVTALRAFANVSQYIVITHNRKTAVGASSAIGVTMEESGISKVIAIRLDEKTSNGELTFDDEEGFVEEDVPEEEGIVIPPRPPRREHNPDGTLKEETKPEANSSAENSSQAEAPSATDNPAEAENPSATDTPAEADTPAVTDNSAQEESAPSPEAEEKAENSSAEGKESESTANNGESSAEEGENPSEKRENPEEEQNN
ncbi:MAG: AAA family ATPase, partial [Treponema sp.]|nr:AAA family ATPase [Treponema sp.]